MGNCDPYSDSPEPVVVKQPKFTRVGEPTLLCNHVVRNERVLQERRKRLHLGPESCGRHREMTLEA